MGDMDSHCLVSTPTSYNHIKTYREDIQEMISVYILIIVFIVFATIVGNI